MYAHWEEVNCSFEPSEVSVMVGGSAQLHVVLDGSYAVTDAVWNVENDDVVSIMADTDKSTATVSSLKPGVTSAEVKLIVLVSGSDEENPVTVRKTVKITSICGHTFGEWKTTEDPTCIAEGTQTRTCSACGKTDTQSISATNKHIDSDDKWKSDENEHYHICDVCGTKFDKSSHTGGEATCTNKAVCSVCGVEYGDLDENSKSDYDISSPQTGYGFGNLVSSAEITIASTVILLIVGINRKKHKKVNKSNKNEQ